MFHSNEADEEAILLANWTYQRLHNTMILHQAVLAGSRISWLMQLPYAIEILCSTALNNGDGVTEQPKRVLPDQELAAHACPSVD